MSGAVFWEFLAVAVLSGVGGFLLAYAVDPWLRGEPSWLDDDLEEPLEGSLEHLGHRRFHLVVDDGERRTVYDWDQDD